MDIEKLKHLFSEKVLSNSENIANDLLLTIGEFFQYTFPSEEERAETLKFFKELVGIIGGGLKEHDVRGHASKWGEQVGEKSLENGGNLGNTIISATVYKKTFWSFIFEEGNKLEVPFENMLEIFSEIDHIFNLIVHGFSSAFTNNAEKLLKESRELYLKISVPIVPVSAKVAVLPLIGEINEMRSETLIVDALDSCVKRRFESLVIDLSGVQEVDMIGIEVLFKLIRSLKLLGVEPLITGMSPEISQTFINLGINLDGVRIYSSLEQALQEISFF